MASKQKVVHNAGNPNTVLVLDLDATLVHSFYKDDPRIEHIKEQKKHGDRLQSIKFFEQENGKESTTKTEMYTMLRPHIDHFLDFVQTKGMFRKVGVWTAGSEAYAEQIIKHTFSDYPPDFVWARTKCHELKDGTLTKPLKLLANHLGVRVENLLIIDDMDYSVACNVNHGLTIPGYDAVTGAEDEDDALKKLVMFFKSPNFYSYRYSHECDRSKIGW